MPILAFLNVGFLLKVVVFYICFCLTQISVQSFAYRSCPVILNPKKKKLD